MKQKLIINKKDFLEFRISDKDDLIELGSLTLEKLKDNETVSIDVIWKTTGYIPINIVRNKDEIDLDKAGYLIDAEELYPENFNVEWI